MNDQASTLKGAEDGGDANRVILRQGALVLERLAREAEAARAEARRIELQDILDQAQRSGDVQALETWLRVNGTSLVSVQSSVSSRAEPKIQGDAGSAPTTERGTSSKLFRSWEGLQKCAEERLQQRHAAYIATSSRGGEALVSQPEEPAQRTCTPTETRNRSAKPGLDVRMDTPLGMESQRESGGEVRRGPRQSLDSDKALLQEVADLENASDAPPGLEVPESGEVAAPREHRHCVQEKAVQELLLKIGGVGEPALVNRRQRLVSRLSGVVASIVAHVLLVVLLAVITLKVPNAVASLALESTSTDASAEAFEVTSPVEVETPAEPDWESSQPETVSEVTETLPDYSEMVSDRIAESLAQTSAGSSLSVSEAAIAGLAGIPANVGASFYGAAATGNCFCFVIDGSGSMRDGPWEAAKAELLRSLNSFKENQRFYIVFFNRELSALPEPGSKEPASSALYATRENLEHARRWLDSLRIDIGAPPYEALEFALNLEPDAIYLLTDGDTTDNVRRKVLELLREKNHLQDLLVGEVIRVPIHTIAFYSEKGVQLLQEVAKDNQGQFIYVPDPRRK